MNNYVVYKHINKFNKKVYIGVTNDINRRWRNNGIEYKPPKKENPTHRSFWNAIKKYGWKNFDHIILEEDLSKDEAFLKEKEYIKMYDSTNKTKGYNISKGGNGGTVYAVHPKGMLGKKQSKTFCLTHSEWAKNHKNNCMTNGTVVWGVTHEHPKGMLGKHHSEKTIAKKRSYCGEKSFSNSEVISINKNGETKKFHSCKMCMEFYGISTTVFYRLIKSGECYKLNPKANYKKRDKEKLRNIEGIRFMYKEDTEVS